MVGILRRLGMSNDIRRTPTKLGKFVHERVTKDDPLPAYLILSGVYTKLAEREGVRKIELLKEGDEPLYIREAYVATRPIASTRSRDSAYMQYRSTLVGKFGKNVWLLAEGHKQGSYVGDNYNADLIAIPAPAGLPDPLSSHEDRIRLSQYLSGEITGIPIADLRSRIPFVDSLLVAMADGSFDFPIQKGLVGRMLGDEIRGSLKILSTDKPLPERKWLQRFGMNYTHPGKTKYNLEAVNLITNGIEIVLSNIKRN